MQVTFLSRKSALIYRRGLRQRVASHILDCNGVFVIKAYAAERLIQMVIKTVKKLSRMFQHDYCICLNLIYQGSGSVQCDR